MAASNGLRQKLQHRLRMMQKRRPKPRDAGIDVDPNYLHRLAVKDPNVFQSSSRRFVLDCHIHILVDGSGSMDGLQARMASTAAMAVATALTGVSGVTTETTAFCGGSSLVFKTAQQARPAPYPVVASGGTPTAEAMTSSLMRMLARKEKRKILIVMTDGCSNDPDAVRQVVETAHRKGVEVIGVGIQHHDSQNTFPTWETISHVDDLPKALLSMVDLMF